MNNYKQRPMLSGDKNIDLNHPQQFVVENIVKNNPAPSQDKKFEIDTDEIVQKLLNTPKIQQIIKSYNNINNKIDVATLELETSRSTEFEKQKIIIDNLKDEIKKIQLDMLEYKTTRNDFHKTINKMEIKVNKCCLRPTIGIENYVLRMLKDLFGMPSHVVTQEDAQSWLRSLFIAKDDLEIRINNLTNHLNTNFNNLIASNTKKIMDDVTNKITKELSRRIDNVPSKTTREIIGSISEEHIKQIVSNALTTYDADKTGLVDYAMEPSGGQIISTRCTETFNARTAQISIWGIPLWYPANTPRTVIMPGIKPGDCWAFQNFPGYLIIKLVQPIRIEMFSYEHINKLLIPGGKITSAPKEFSVFGLKNENDKDSIEIGRFTYDMHGDALQYFPVNNTTFVFDMIELVIHNNHGNPNYTCLYRFRVHGTPTAEPT